ncbi:MAG: aldose 1-epimerase [Wujia sp.]
MGYSAEIIDYKGKEAIALTAGKYQAIIAPFLGSNVLRMRDTEHGIEVFRYDESLSVEQLQASAEVYGLPTLYLPNRLAAGKLKVSDATYQLPINEVSFNNHIHGFLHKREHRIVSATADGKNAVAKTEYVYDSSDPFFEYLPVSFRAEYTFTLSDDGLDYAFTMTNTSDRQLPYGVCNHTTINGPFTENGNGLDMRLYVPIGEKWELSKYCIPTGSLLPYTNHDRQYLTGSQVPVLHIIDNDVFFAEEGTLDGKPYYGAAVTDAATGLRICYEVCKDFKFWILWNDQGQKGYFCPEPCTWIIDAPNQPIPAEESGYLELAPGESKTLTQKVYTA